jgi:hypothetical protein
MYTNKQNTFIQSLLAAKAFTSCPYELQTSKSHLRAIPTTILFILLKVFTPKQPLSDPSTPGDSTLATLAAIYSLLFRRNRSLV